VEKLLTFHGRSDRGVFNYVIDHSHSFLEKTAAEYHPKIASYIANAKPIPGAIQVLLTALGAGEYWGANANGDYFPRDALAHDGTDYGHQTFLQAHPYMHHVNKDPAKSYGKVTLSVYNPAYQRVELIIVIQKDKAPDLAARIDAGEMVDWSMGCKVPFDVCSICGNKAPNRKYYCDHAKYYLNKIWPGTGQPVYVINTQPKFHDISYVLIGADRIAKTLMKVASVPQQQTISSAYAAEKLALTQKTSNETKGAAIEKQIPVDSDNPPASTDDVKRLMNPIVEMKAREPMLPKEKLDALARHPLEQSMGTLAAMGILPKPQEYQRIVLIKMGQEKLANKLWDANICFDPASIEGERGLCKISYDNYNPRIFELMKGDLSERSCYHTFLLPRVARYDFTSEPTGLPKLASVENGLTGESREELFDRRDPISPLAMMAIAALGYKALSADTVGASAKGLDRLLQKSPGLAVALGVGLLGGSKALFGAKVKGHQDPQLSNEQKDFMQRLSEAQDRPYVKIAGIHPGSAVKRLGMVPLAYMASGVLQKRKEADPYKDESGAGKFLRKYPDLVGGALVVDAMLSGKGKGSRRIFKTMADAQAKHSPKVKSMFDQALHRQFSKVAGYEPDADDLIKVALLDSPLGAAALEAGLFGSRRNYQAKLMGSLADQTFGRMMINKMTESKDKKKTSI
jgi:hypothetical protein